VCFAAGGFAVAVVGGAGALGVATVVCFAVGGMAEVAAGSAASAVGAGFAGFLAGAVVGAAGVGAVAAAPGGARFAVLFGAGGAGGIGRVVFRRGVLLRGGLRGITCGRRRIGVRDAERRPQRDRERPRVRRDSPRGGSFQPHGAPPFTRRGRELLPLQNVAT